MSKIVKKAFMFRSFDNPEPVRIEEGNLISYEFYNNTNNIRITMHGPDGNITLDGPTLYLNDYVRDVEYDDLVHPKVYMFEQQKDRTYREGVTKNYGFVDNLDKVVEDGKDEANYDKRINTAAVLNYFHKITNSEDPMDKRVIEWIASEIKRLNDEMKRLDILTASDEDIIQNALMEYGNQECYSNDTEIANKITDVRNRYLEMIRSCRKGGLMK